MSALADRLERDLREIAAGAHPSSSAWESVVARLGEAGVPEAAPMLGPDPRRSKRPVWMAVAAAALVMITGSIAVLTRDGDDHSISTADMKLTSTFVSPRNGFSVRYFDRGGGTVTPATDVGDLGNEQPDAGVDVVEIDSATTFWGASVEAPDGPISIDQYVDEYVTRGCGLPRSRQEKIIIDGQVGRTSECPNKIGATVVTGGRLYLFSLLHDRRDARAVFDAFIATIDLTPQTAVDFPNLTSTFVSPTYGFSFGYIDRGGLVPAKQIWDPANQPFDFASDDRFDAVETGYGAYFEAASTKIPDGVSIDAWVDRYVPPGCGGPRSRQGAITIDGQPGRISECPNEIDATVVVGGRLYRFALLHSRSRDARAFFDAFIATIDLRPEAATAP